MNRLTNSSSLKSRLRNRERIFAGWVSYSHPSITETFAASGFDFIAIDMEHGTINLAEAQRIIAASQSYGVPCLPRPVSHSNDWTKPLLDSGADGMLFPMVNSVEEVNQLVSLCKYPPVGNRSFGVNRAQEYGFIFQQYVETWNTSSILVLQIESALAVKNIESMIVNEAVDGVMVGPYDLSGSLGVPGQTDHPLVLEASAKVIEACKKHGKSCGTQIADVTPSALEKHFELGYTYAILGSDLFVLWKWAASMKELMKGFKA